MRFSEEYKKSAESMSPDRQTIDRMKAAVLKELQEHPEAPAEPERKPLPLRRIAYIGGAVAACAVITIAAVNIVPALRSSNDMIASGANAEYSGADEDSSIAAAEIKDSAAPDLPNLSLITVSTAEDYSDDSVNEDAADAAEDEAADDLPESSINSIAGADSFIETPDTDISDSGFTPESTVAEPSASLSADSVDEAPSNNKGHATPANDGINEFAPATEEMDISTEEAITEDSRGNPESGWDGLPSNDWQPTMEAGTIDSVFGETGEAFAETLEVYETEEEALATEEADRGNPMTGGADIIVISPKGWLTYNGERYDLVKKASAPLDTYRRYEAYAPTEGRLYYVVINDSMLYLYDVKMNFIAGYRKS